MNSSADTPEEKDGLYWKKYMQSISCFMGATPQTQGFNGLRTAAEQIKFVGKLLKQMEASLDVKNCEKKDNKKSLEYRDAGNKLYASKNRSQMITAIAEEYTKCIAYAQPGSEELAVGFANRSAVLFCNQRYAECLLDIERAFDNYPDVSKAKLCARRVRCLASMNRSGAELEEAVSETRKWLAKMGENGSGRETVEKILTDENYLATPAAEEAGDKPEKIKVAVPTDNPGIVGASSAVEISYSEECGMHLRATREIRPGEVIAVQKMFCGILPREATYRNCANCYVETSSGLPCDHCVHVIYCSPACRDEAWSEYHEIECQVLSPLFALGYEPSNILHLRMVIRGLKAAGGFVQLKSMVEESESVSDSKMKGLTNGIFDGTKYAALAVAKRDRRPRHMALDFLTATEAVFTTHMLATRTDIFGEKFRDGFQAIEEDESARFTAELLVKHNHIVHDNQISQPLPDNSTKVEGISPFCALLNHSCDPNLAFLFKSKIIMYASKLIKEGEQIYDCYDGLEFLRCTKSERQRKLQHHWKFICKCPACQNDWPMYPMIPNLSDLSDKITIEQATLISKPLKLCNSGKKGPEMKTEDFLNLYENVIELIELICRYVSVPSKELLIAQATLRACYNDIIDRL